MVYKLWETPAAKPLYRSIFYDILLWCLYSLVHGPAPAQAKLMAQSRKGLIILLRWDGTLREANMIWAVSKENGRSIEYVVFDLETVVYTQ